MILSQPEIRESVARGKIRLDPPLEERQWHEASVDLRLGFKFTKLTMPCQLTFFQLTSELPEDVSYGARPTDSFQGQSRPIPTERG
jgi:deoxycytidine triphosphate deaminase